MSEYIKMDDTLIYNYQKDIIDEKDKEIERLNNIIKNTSKELEILLDSENIELIIMQLNNIAFRLKEVIKSE